LYKPRSYNKKSKKINNYLLPQAYVAEFKNGEKILHKPSQQVKKAFANLSVPDYY